MVILRTIVSFKYNQKTKPDEIYNLAAQSAAVSFEVPEYTANAMPLF